MRRLTVLLLLVVVCGTVHASFGAIVVSSDNTYAQVQIGLSTSFNQQPNSGTGADAHALFSLAHESFTRTTFTPTFLHGSFLQRRPGALTSLALGYYTATFTVSANSTYQVLGNYQDSAGWTHFHLHLDDITTSSSLFVNEQVSDGGASFFAGNTAGNISNILTGSMSGFLQVGHTYEWYVLAYSQAASQVDPGAGPMGSAALLVAELPEATSAIVWSLVTISTAALPRRRRT
jgi:hypothetical protein